MPGGESYNVLTALDRRCLVLPVRFVDCWQQAVLELLASAMDSYVFGIFALNGASMTAGGLSRQFAGCDSYFVQIDASVAVVCYYAARKKDFKGLRSHRLRSSRMKRSKPHRLMMLKKNWMVSFA